MTSWLSRPVETLLADNNFPFHDIDAQQHFRLHTDVLVVGSGYGAAMAALAMMESASSLPASARPEVWVFERGQEYLPDDFPKSMADVPGYLGTDQLNPSALWDVRAGDGVVTVSGRGLGGTSLVNANVAARPADEVLAKWPANDDGTRWSDELATCYKKIETLLGVQRHPRPQDFARYRAMSATASALGASAEAAPLTINFKGPGAHSADHGPCNLCGNCVVGCHSGAKGSLNMNAWPLVRQLGADIYAGVIVNSLRRVDDGWLVECAPASRPDERIYVHAGKVILGAGTLGSTEILMRSQRLADLGLSPTLGDRFSTNGDALVFSIGQAGKVGEVASPPGQHPPATQPGPTIMGMASVALDSSDRFTLEDAVIPYPTRQIWQELLVSQNLIRRFADGSRSAWHQANPRHDELAISDTLAEHSQTLLIMGPDEGSGKLRFADDRLRPSWSRGDTDYFQRLDDRMREDEAVAFDGGLYSPNALSQPLPPGFDGIVEGAGELSGQLVSVHPLGGCCMGSDINTGVVNARGQVFSSVAEAGVWEDLYVLDGAIIPGAIGTNPFLTIAALSYTLAARILADEQYREVVTRPLPALQPEFRRIPAGGLHPVPDEKENEVAAEFRERLVLHLDDNKRSFFPWSRAAPERKKVFKFLQQALPQIAVPDDTRALVLDAAFRFADENTLDAWLQQPQAPLRARATLAADTIGSILTTADRHLQPLLDLEGWVTLGYTEPARSWRDTWRTASAILRYLHYRTMDLLVQIPLPLARLLLSKKALAVRSNVATNSAGVLSQLRAFWRIGRLQARRRYLVYEFSSDEGLRISGRKTLGFGLGLQDPLRALMVLPVAMQHPDAGKIDVTLELDGIRVTQGPAAPLQILSSPHSAATITAAGGLGMYFLRMIMNTHFWSFSAPSYDRFAERRQLESDDKQGRFFTPPDFMHYGHNNSRCSLKKEVFEYSGEHNGKTIPLSRLVRYQPGEGDTSTRKSLMLVHGLAHSSRVFWTDTIDCNFVQYFLAQNYDVWILDHRASANYIREVTPEHTWDSIAMEDIPWAIATAFEQVNAADGNSARRGIHVFSHCIGAGAVAMSVLAGKLDYTDHDTNGTPVRRSMLASLVPHAVTPWLTTSGENRARANMWALVKELEPIRIIEPLPYRQPAGLEMIYDRLAALSMNADERKQWSAWRGFRDWRGPGFAQSIYTRYTIFWGRQWHNNNISNDTRYEFAGMIGPVPIGVMQQVYFSLTRGLLSDHDGANSYVREENFSRYWTFPSYFLHGNRNTVFDMESSRQSADKLTRLRRKQRSSEYYTGELEPLDYARENIWVDVLNDYGHMDMIFSKSAHQDVFPRLHEFFVAADEEQMLAVYQQRYRDADSKADFLARCASNSHVRPADRPLVGPIISRPAVSHPGMDSEAEGGQQMSIRLWVEAQDFTALPALGLTMVTDAPASESLHAIPEKLAATSEGEAGEAIRTWQQEFWLYDFVFAADSAHAHRLSLNYGESACCATDATLTTGASSEGILLRWHDLPWFNRMLSADASAPQALTVLAGSCLYPGLPFERDQAMQIFAGMAHHIADDKTSGLRGADCMILLGDQIYADATADLFDPKAPYERFRNPYRIAFGNPEARRLMSHLPSYFAVDDHEYRDNWRGQLADEPHIEYARRMAWLYQMHYQSEWDYQQLRLWYSFESAGHPFFVFDSRLQRRQDALADGTALLDQQQIDAFSEWLQAQADKPVLFLATGSPLAPVPRAIHADPALAVYDDSLLAYPRFLALMVDLLDRHAANKRIVWLCGDPHFSCFARVRLSSGTTSVSLLQVCSSGMYAPMPFINSNINDYDWKSPISVSLRQPGKDPLENVVVDVRQVLLSNHQQHFVRLDLEPGHDFRLRLQAFAADGRSIGPAWHVDRDNEEVPA